MHIAVYFWFFLGLIKPHYNIHITKIILILWDVTKALNFSLLSPYKEVFNDSPKALPEENAVLWKCLILKDQKIICSTEGKLIAGSNYNHISISKSQKIACIIPGSLS